VGLSSNMKHLFRALVCEAEFGATTSMEFEVINNVVTNVEDTSTFETNYYWDRWSPRELELEGMSLQKAFQVLSSKFDDFEDEYRHPWVSIEIVK
jgi:hypothetical protein